MGCTLKQRVMPFAGGGFWITPHVVRAIIVSVLRYEINFRALLQLRSKQIVLIQIHAVREIIYALGLEER